METSMQFGICDVCLSGGDVFLLDCKCGRSICAECAASQLKRDVYCFSSLEYLSLRCTQCMLSKHPTCWYCGGSDKDLITCSCFVAFHAKCAQYYGIINCPLHKCWTCKKALKYRVFCCYLCLRSFHHKCDGVAKIIDNDQMGFCACICKFCSVQHKLRLSNNQPLRDGRVRACLRRHHVELSNANVLFYEEVYIELLLSFFQLHSQQLFTSINAATQDKKSEIIDVFYNILYQVYTAEQQIVLYNMLTSVSRMKLLYFQGGTGCAIASIMDLFSCLVNYKPFTQLAKNAAYFCYDDCIDAFRFYLGVAAPSDICACKTLDYLVQKVRETPVFGVQNYRFAQLLKRRMFFIVYEHQKYPFRFYNKSLVQLLQYGQRIKQLEPYFGGLAYRENIILELERYVQVIMLISRFGKAKAITCVGEQVIKNIIQEYNVKKVVTPNKPEEFDYSYGARKPIRLDVFLEERARLYPKAQQQSDNTSVSKKQTTISNYAHSPPVQSFPAIKNQVSALSPVYERQIEDTKGFYDLKMLVFFCYCRITRSHVLPSIVATKMTTALCQAYDNKFDGNVYLYIYQLLSKSMSDAYSSLMEPIICYFKANANLTYRPREEPFFYFYQIKRAEIATWAPLKFANELRNYVVFVFRKNPKIDLTYLTMTMTQMMSKHSENPNWDTIQFNIYVDNERQIALRAVKFLLLEMRLEKATPSTYSKSPRSGASARSDSSNTVMITSPANAYYNATAQSRLTKDIETYSSQKLYIPISSSNYSAVPEQTAYNTIFRYSNAAVTTLTPNTQITASNHYSGSLMPKISFQTANSGTFAQTYVLDKAAFYNSIGRSSMSGAYRNTAQHQEILEDYDLRRRLLIKAIEERRCNWRYHVIREGHGNFCYPVYEQALVTELHNFLYHPATEKPPKTEQFVIRTEKLEHYYIEVHISEY